jgi:hypothetical protein
VDRGRRKRGRHLLTSKTDRARGARDAWLPPARLTSGRLPGERKRVGRRTYSHTLARVLAWAS